MPEGKEIEEESNEKGTDKKSLKSRQAVFLLKSNLRCETPQGKEEYVEVTQVIFIFDGPSDKDTFLKQLQFRLIGPYLCYRSYTDDNISIVKVIDDDIELEEHHPLIPRTLDLQ